MRLVVALAVLMLPTAAGQVTYDLTLEGPDATAPIAPDTGMAEVAVAWTVSCTTTASPGAPGTEPGTLAWDPPEADAPGIVVAGATTATTALPDCATAMEARGTHPFEVQATREAPGLTPITIAFAAELAWEGAGRQTASASGQVETSVAYVGLVHAKAMSSIQQGGPGETTTYEVQVTNVGNAPSRVLIAVEDDRVEVPDVWPDTPLAEDENGTLEVLYHHPDGAGWNNGEATFTLELTPVAAADESLDGATVIVNSLARTRGMPAAAFPLLVAAVAVAAAVRRSR